MKTISSLLKSQAVETLLMSLMESKEKEVEDGALGNFARAFTSS